MFIKNSNILIQLFCSKINQDLFPSKAQSRAFDIQAACRDTGQPLHTNIVYDEKKNFNEPDEWKYYWMYNKYYLHDLRKEKCIFFKRN